MSFKIFNTSYVSCLSATVIWIFCQSNHHLQTTMLTKPFITTCSCRALADICRKKRGFCCYQQIPGFGRWQSAVFPCLATLKRLANHLALLIPNSNDSLERQNKDKELLEIAMPDEWRDLYRDRDNILNYANTAYCGKWKVLRHLLQYWHSAGDKVLVFSHSVRLLKMFEMLFKTCTSYNVSYLDGSMTLDQRAQAVSDFNSDPRQFVFLISTKAGGVGLNITSANKVVVVDPNWNPAYDLQAQDRAYRIGQTRDVEVFRLVSAGTIEEIVYARQIYKQQQANIGYNASHERRYFKGIEGQKDRKGEIFGLRNMFSFRDKTIVLQDIVNQTNIAEAREAARKVGVLIAEIEVEDTRADDGDLLDEDAAMSQVAEEIAKGSNLNEDATWKGRKANKTDPIAAILAGAGVQYTHENSEVVGSSKIEAGLSRNALEEQNDVGLIDKPVFQSVATQDEISHDIDNEGLDNGMSDSIGPGVECVNATTLY
jgi:DNA excision repair protein ERCC-6-like 2